MAPKGDSQGNGAAENAVQAIEGMTRTLASALESRVKCKIQPEWNIMAWIIEWAALLLRPHR
eukprot:2033350-Karenia_brevis.AAC.1